MKIGSTCDQEIKLVSADHHYICNVNRYSCHVPERNGSYTPDLCLFESKSKRSFPGRFLSGCPVFACRIQKSCGPIRNWWGGTTPMRRDAPFIYRSAFLFLFAGIVTSTVNVPAADAAERRHGL